MSSRIKGSSRAIAPALRFWVLCDRSISAIRTRRPACALMGRRSGLRTCRLPALPIRVPYIVYYAYHSAHVRGRSPAHTARATCVTHLPPRSQTSVDPTGAVRGRTAIVGLGATEQGELPGRSANEIAVEAFRIALEEAELAKSDVNGLITCRSYGNGGIDTDIGSMAGINPAYSATLDYGTCNFSLHVAAMAIAAGMADTVAIMYGTNQRSAG